jgi:hypothetical protein
LAGGERLEVLLSDIRNQFAAKPTSAHPGEFVLVKRLLVLARLRPGSLITMTLVAKVLALIPPGWE